MPGMSKRFREMVKTAASELRWKSATERLRKVNPIDLPPTEGLDQGWCLTFLEFWRAWREHRQRARHAQVQGFHRVAWNRDRGLARRSGRHRTRRNRLRLRLGLDPPAGWLLKLSGGRTRCAGGASVRSTDACKRAACGRGLPLGRPDILPSRRTRLHAGPRRRSIKVGASQGVWRNV